MTDDSIVTSDILESITNMHIADRTEATADAVMDLTGLDLLTGLTNVYINYHEVADITNIKWEKLSNLTHITLRGNNITALPDWSKNTKLQYIYLNDNMLSEQVIAGAGNKIPAGAQFSCDNQRVNGFELLVEDTYYIYGSESAICVKPVGYKSGFAYTFKFYVDGIEKTFTPLDAWSTVYCLDNAGLSDDNSHRIKAELWNGETKEAETEEYTFNIVEESIFVKDGVYYFNSASGNRQNTNVTVYFDSNKAISKASMLNDSGKIYAETEYSVNLYSWHRDPRFEVLTDAALNKLYYASIGLQYRYNTIPAGTYNLKIEYTDGTNDILEGVIVSTSAEEVAITSCSVGYNYDNTGEYMYLRLEGENIDPSKLDYTLQKNGVYYPVSYKNHKQMYSGIIVKLQKEGWTTLDSGSVDIKISGKSGYTVASGDIFLDLSISGGAFYSVYNELTKKLEVAFAEETKSGNESVKISVRMGYDANTYPEIAYGSAVVSDGVAYFDLKNPDGTAFTPTNRTTYYFTCILNGKAYDNNTYISLTTGNSNTNYWGSKSVVLQGASSVSFYYYSDLDYSGANIVASNYSAEVTGGNLSSPITVNKSVAGGIWTSESSGFTTLGMNFDLSSLEQGTYQVTLYKNGAVLSSKSFVVKGSEKFIIESVSASWISKSEIRVYLSTPNTSETDDYTVSLIDLEGNTVSGVTTTVTNRYVDMVYLSVTGLNYVDASRKYYLKITHKTLGEACTVSGEAYYSDDKGTLTTIYYSNSSYTTIDGRMVGLYLANSEFPVTVKIYKPYETEVIKEFVISNASLLTNGYYYYFTKALYDSLPIKDSMYDVVVIPNDNRVNSFTKIIGYAGIEQEELVWDCVVDRRNLFINKDEEKTATITVINNKKNPTYKSSDTSVVTVKADADNPAKAVITAVGLGVAEISVTTDGITKKFNITVERKIEVEELVLNQTELTLGVGDTQTLTASLLPVEAWNEEQVIHFVSSNEEVITITPTEENGVVVLTAVKAEPTETVVITATLDGTEFTASCNVVVSGVYSEAEKQTLVEEVGVKKVLLNSYPKNTAYLRDISLPDGWSWEDGSIKLVADNAAPIQYYMANYTKDGYKAFDSLLPVAVSKLTGITVEGDKTITAEKEKEYQIIEKYTGYQTDSDFDSHFSYSWTASGKKPIVEVASPQSDQTVITAGSVTKNTAQTVNVVITIDGDAKKVFKSSVKLTVVPKPYVDEIVIDKADEQLATEVTSEYENGILNVEYADISTKKGEVANTVRLEATVSIDGEESATAIKWTSSDTSVATIKAEKNTKNAVLTVKKAGTAVIHAIANDGGKLDQEMLLVVKDYTPVMEAKKVTVSLFDLAGTVLPIKPQNGNTINNIDILENGEISTRFTVEESGNNFIVRTSDESGFTKNTNVNVVLKIETNKDVYADSKAQAFTITVDAKKKPSASVKVKSKANLFYTDAAAVYTVTSKNIIEDIVDVTEGSGPRFHAVYDKIAGTITFDTNGELDKNTLAIFKDKKAIARKLTLKVKFAGYSSEADQTIKVTVATEEKKPSLKLNDIILVSGKTQSITQVYDTKAKVPYTLADTETISVTYDNSKTNDVTAVRTGDKVTVTYDGNKNVTYKAALDSAKWTQALTIPGKITVAKIQNLVLGSNKVILNTAHSIQKNGKQVIGVSVKNNDAVIQKITYKVDKKNAALFNNGYLSITFDEATQQMYVGLNKDCRGKIKAGSYKVNIGGTVEIGSQEVALKETALTVTLVDKAPTVSLSGKGSIDLVRRADTSILYTPKLGNVTAQIERVKLAGSYAAYFTAKVVDGKIEVKATNQAMSTKMTYPVKVIMTLDNNCEVTAIVKIKPVNKLPKITAAVTKATMYKMNPESISFGLTSSIKEAEIDKVVRVQDKNSKYFDFEYDKLGNIISVSLSEEAVKMKPGNYSISYQVYLKGAAYNVKPVTVKLTLSVK